MILETTLSNVVWISGEMYSGKDFIGDVLRKNYGYTKLSLADALKDEIAQLNGITREELEAVKGKYRKQLQAYGVAKRKVNPNYWIQKWEEQYKVLLNQGITRVYCSDCRFQNEALYCVGNGWFLVQVKTPFEVRKQRMIAATGSFDAEALDHPSEKDMKSKMWPKHMDISGTLSPMEIMPQLEQGWQRLTALRNRLRMDQSVRLRGNG